MCPVKNISQMAKLSIFHTAKHVIPKFLCRASQSEEQSQHGALSVLSDLEGGSLRE